MYRGQTVLWIKMKLGMEIGLGPIHIVLDGAQLPLPKGAHPQFSAHVCCGQTAGWNKMPLGTEVGLGPGDIVLDGDQSPQKRGGQQPPFVANVLWPNGYVHKDATWYGGRPRPRPHCIRCKPSFHPSQKGHSTHFSAHVYC